MTTKCFRTSEWGVRLTKCMTWKHKAFDESQVLLLIFYHDPVYSAPLTLTRVKKMTQEQKWGLKNIPFHRHGAGKRVGRSRAAPLKIRAKSQVQVSGGVQTRGRASTKGMLAIEPQREGDDRLLFNSISRYVRGAPHLAAHDLWRIFRSRSLSEWADWRINPGKL